MENAQSILNKVSMFFAELVGDQMTSASGDVSGVVAPVKMVAAKLKDGTAIEISDMMVGGIVTIGGVAAPVGEHLLEDGTILVVGDNGAIMEIKPAMEEVAPAIPEGPIVQEDMSVKFAAFESVTNQKFASYEDKFAAYEVKLTQANKVIEGLMQLSKMLVEAPQAQADSSVKNSNAFSEVKRDARAEFENFSKSICS